MIVPAISHIFRCCQGNWVIAFEKIYNLITKVIQMLVKMGFFGKWPWYQWDNTLWGVHCHKLMDARTIWHTGLMLLVGHNPLYISNSKLYCDLFLMNALPIPNPWLSLLHTLRYTTSFKKGLCAEVWSALVLCHWWHEITIQPVSQNTKAWSLFGFLPSESSKEKRWTLLTYVHSPFMKATQNANCWTIKGLFFCHLFFFA